MKATCHVGTYNTPLGLVGSSRIDGERRIGGSVSEVGEMVLMCFAGFRDTLLFWDEWFDMFPGGIYESEEILS